MYAIPQLSVLWADCLEDIYINLARGKFMDPKITNVPTTEDHITISMSRNVRNSSIAKLIALVVLTSGLGFFFISSSESQYQEGKNLTQEKYLAKFEDYKAKLTSKGEYSQNKLLSVFSAFIALSFFIGSYELTVLLIRVLIGKFARR